MAQSAPTGLQVPSLAPHGQPFSNNSGRVRESAPAPTLRTLWLITQGEKYFANSVTGGAAFVASSKVQCLDWVNDGAIYRPVEPLIGNEGTGYSPAIMLAQKLADTLGYDRVVLVPMSFNDVKIADYRESGSLNPLIGIVARRVLFRLNPLDNVTVIVQIGATDTILGTPRSVFMQGMSELVRTWRSNGIMGKIFIDQFSYAGAAPVGLSGDALAAFQAQAVLNARSGLQIRAGQQDACDNYDTIVGADIDQFLDTLRVTGGSWTAAARDTVAETQKVRIYNFYLYRMKARRHDSSMPYLIGKTPADYLALREKVKSLVRGNDPSTGTLVATPYVTGSSLPIVTTAPSTSETLTITMSRGITSTAAYLRMTPNTGHLMVWNFGHGGGYRVTPGDPISTARDYYSAGVKAYLNALAALGYDLLLLSMPLQGDNRFNASQLGVNDLGADLGGGYGGDHSNLVNLRPPSGSSLRYFVDPVSRALDYVLTKRNYNKVCLSGLSGGGWTTVVAGAMEPRIDAIYSVAGTLPVMARGGDTGDWEQSYSELWGGFDYLDLYLMAVAEPTRRAMHLHHEFDSCCFQAWKTVAYAAPMTFYAYQNGFGPLRFTSESDLHDHDVADYDRTKILEDLASF